MTDSNYRQNFVSEMERLKVSVAMLNLLLPLQKSKALRMVAPFMIEMKDADIAKYRKAIDTIDGRITYLEFGEWFVSHTAQQRDRLIFLREFIEANRDNKEFDGAEMQAYDVYLQDIKDRLLDEAHDNDQFSAALAEADARLLVNEYDGRPF